MKRALGLATAAALIVAVGTGCGLSGAESSAGFSGNGKVRVATTTNFITDLAQRVGGDRVQVVGLMGPGVDPHLYRASAGDVETLRDADIVFYNGLLLEAKMEDVLEEIGESKPAVAVSEDMPEGRLLPAPTGAPAEEEYDPHVWFDVSLWRYAAETVRDALSEVDPDGAETYTRNAETYLAELDRLDAEVRAEYRTIPAERRVLVTSHDAFRYLGRAYGVEVAAIQGISTASEATTDDIERVADLVAERGVKSIFIESSVPRQTIEAVLAAARERGQTTRIGGELFSDAAGAAGTPEGTYVGMVRANAETIVRGLK
jgi:manganese/zinc/iron transport system substrate-binding protein